MSNIHFDFTIDTVMMIVIFNVILTALHYLLYWLHETKKYSWPEGPLTAVTFMMSMLSILMGNLKHNPASPKEPQG